MSFHIKFLDGGQTLDENGKRLAILGEICLGSFVEKFESPLVYWVEKDYQLHWKNAIANILLSDKTCLITSFYDPKSSNFLLWWLLYRKEESVIFQNQVFFLDQKLSFFDEQNLYKLIPNYRNTNPDGKKISEWIVSIDEIRKFLSLSN